MKKKLSICLGAVASSVMLVTLLSGCGGVSPASPDYASSKATSSVGTSSVTSSYSSSYTYSSKYTTTSSRSQSSSGCGFKYSDGSVCGASVGSHAPLCDYHFNQLNDTYNDVVSRMNNLE